MPCPPGRTTLRPATSATGSRLLAPPAAKSGIQMTQAPLAIRDRQGRVLVDVYARQDASFAAVRDRAEAAGLDTVAQSAGQRAVEGCVALSDVNALANAAGVSSVSLGLRPFTNVGAATSQGVAAERVDKVRRGIDGRGITVGALSDSFDTATEFVGGGALTVHASDDIRTGDLPPEGVTVLQDAAGGADEGRATRAASRTSTPGRRPTSPRTSCSAATRRATTAAGTASSTCSGTSRSTRPGRHSACR